MTRKPYADPYLAGVGLGLVLLACFALSGQGLGASGAFAGLASHVSGAVARNAWVDSYLSTGWASWMVVEVGGLIVGAGLSAWLAGRTVSIATPTSRGRLVAASAGGVLMGVGAALARGCTSGLALSGGAMLSVGAWVFMVALFAAGFLAAPLLRRLWA
jgi:uncharacterized membrane protein YedE/YeeE